MPSPKSVLKKIWLLILILTVSVFWAQQYLWLVAPEGNGSDAAPQSACDVARIKLYGTLLTYTTEEDKDTVSSADIVRQIEEADNNDNIKAILLDIDSTGGYPVAGEEIANALKKSKKPTIAVIRQAGTSAAYWAATGADKIFASSLSDVGSIGITMSYLDNSKKNENEGLTYNSLSSGTYKDAGDPDKPLTDEEKALLEKKIKAACEEFVRQVADNRHMDIEKVRTLSDGSSVSGSNALSEGLIDRIGGIYEAQEYLKGAIGEDMAVCY